MNVISSSQCRCILTGAMLLNQSSCFFQATSGRYFQVTISSTCCNVRWEYYGDWYIVSSVACFSMYPTTGSFKRIEVFKIRMRAIKMDQINIWSCACFSSLWDILSGGIKIDFSFKIEWIRSMWKLGSKILMHNWQFSNCYNSLNFQDNINCNTTRQNVLKWRKTCTALILDLVFSCG